MEKLVASLKGNTFLLLLSAWLAASLVVGAFAYFDRGSALAMLASPWHAIILAFLLLCLTLGLVYERSLPIGGYSAMMAVYGLLLATFFVNTMLFAAGILVGIFLDLLYARMFVRHTAWTLKMRVFSAIAPVAVWVGYLSSFYMLRMEPWSVQFCMWSTACIAVAGFLISFLLKPNFLLKAN